MRHRLSRLIMASSPEIPMARTLISCKDSIAERSIRRTWRMRLSMLPSIANDSLLRLCVESLNSFCVCRSRKEGIGNGCIQLHRLIIDAARLRARAVVVYDKRCRDALNFQVLRQTVFFGDLLAIGVLALVENFHWQTVFRGELKFDCITVRVG